MKLRFIFSIFVFVSISSIYCQNNRPSSQSNPNLDFTNFISGVKYAYVVMNDNVMDDINKGIVSTNAWALLGIMDYLKEVGFYDVKYGKQSEIPQSFPSICDQVMIFPSYESNAKECYNIKLSFVSCKNDIFTFETKNTVWHNGQPRIEFNKRCREMYGLKKGYSEANRLNLSLEMTEWDEEKLKKHFNDNGVDVFEGIYESATSTDQDPKYRLGVIKNGDSYNMIYFSGAPNFLDWKMGEIKSKLIPTATASLFKANWKMRNKFINENAYVSFEPGLLNLSIQGFEKSLYIKLYPTSTDGIKGSNTSKASGTGFGISSNGLIVTNSHVINGANSIKVRGLNGDFSKRYLSKTILEDKNNDLAIIQVIDSNFKSLGSIPYTISTKPSDVGSSVFVLGYPLKALMGDEIKLTNGIISSKSGFQGDITSYQISVPLQPGNSGGPLFDSNGNLIGVVNAKLTVGENVSYAIKSAYLINLIDLLPAMPDMPHVNILVGKQLTEQVKLINKYIYIIEVN
jgi:S1-C subfamily serine protease